MNYNYEVEKAKIALRAALAQQARIQEEYALAAQALIDAVADKGREQGWGVIRWITAEDNYRARGVYDRVAARTPWVTYDIKL